MARSCQLAFHMRAACSMPDLNISGAARCLLGVEPWYLLAAGAQEPPLQPVLAMQDCISYTVRNQGGHEVVIKTKPHQPFYKKMVATSEWMDMPMAELRWLYQGTRLSANQTSGDVGLAGDVVDVVTELPVLCSVFWLASRSGC